MVQKEGWWQQRPRLWKWWRWLRKQQRWQRFQSLIYSMGFRPWIPNCILGKSVMYMKKNACTCLFIKSLQLLIAKDLLFVCGIILTGILLRVKWENEINTTYPHWLLKNCQQQKFICLKQISSAQTENLEVRCREARTTFPQLECCQCTVVAAHPNSNGS